MYVIIDCGGFKQIIPKDKTSTIRQIQDDFRGAMIEGDASGKPNVYTGAEISAMFNGRGDRVQDKEVLSPDNIKVVPRRSVG